MARNVDVENYWQTLRGENYSSVQDAFYALSEEDIQHMTKFIPTIPPSKTLENARGEIMPEEYNTLKYYASIFPSRYMEPKFSRWDYPNVEKCKMIWDLVKKELYEYIDLYAQYMLLAKKQAGLSTAAQMREEKGMAATPIGHKKDKFIHV